MAAKRERHVVAVKSEGGKPNIMKAIAMKEHKSKQQQRSSVLYRVRPPTDLSEGMDSETRQANSLLVLEDVRIDEEDGSGVLLTNTEAVAAPELAGGRHNRHTVEEIACTWAGHSH